MVRHLHGHQSRSTRVINYKGEEFILRRIQNSDKGSRGYIDPIIGYYPMRLTDEADEGYFLDDRIECFYVAIEKSGKLLAVAEFTGIAINRSYQQSSLHDDLSDFSSILGISGYDMMKIMDFSEGYPKRPYLVVFNRFHEVDYLEWVSGPAAYTMMKELLFKSVMELAFEYFGWKHRDMCFIINDTVNEKEKEKQLCYLEYPGEPCIDESCLPGTEDIARATKSMAMVVSIDTISTKAFWLWLIKRVIGEISKFYLHPLKNTAPSSSAGISHKEGIYDVAFGNEPYAADVIEFYLSLNERVSNTEGTFEYEIPLFAVPIMLKSIMSLKLTIANLGSSYIERIVVDTDMDEGLLLATIDELCYLLEVTFEQCELDCEMNVIEYYYKDLTMSQ